MILSKDLIPAFDTIKYSISGYVLSFSEGSFKKNPLRQKILRETHKQVCEINLLLITK